MKIVLARPAGSCGAARCRLRQLVEQRRRNDRRRRRHVDREDGHDLDRHELVGRQLDREHQEHDTSTESTSTTGTVPGRPCQRRRPQRGLQEGRQPLGRVLGTRSRRRRRAARAQDLETDGQAFESFANQVPGEIRDDFKVIAAAFTKYIQVIKDLDLTPGKTPTAGDIAKLTRGLPGAGQRPGQGCERGGHEVGDRQLLTGKSLSRHLGLSPRSTRRAGLRGERRSASLPGSAYPLARINPISA